MAFSSHLRRLSSFVIRSLGSSPEPRGAISAVHLHNRRLLGAQLLPSRRFSTNPDDHKKSEKPFEGLPGFGDVIYKDGLLTLTRKTKDEIIKVQVKRNIYKKNEGECLSMQVSVRYGEGFRKWMELEILVFPDEQDRIAIKEVSMSVLEPKWYEEGTLHIEELEEFFKKRGIEHQNFNFLFDYIEKIKQMDEAHDAIGKKVHGEA